jgi:hypothetical protein
MDVRRSGVAIAFLVIGLTNAVFWVALAIVGWTRVNQSTGTVMMVAVLLSAEPLAYLGLLWMANRFGKVGVVLMGVLAGANAVLSVTDEIGTLDVVSLALSILMCISCVLALTETNARKQAGLDADGR